MKNETLMTWKEAIKKPSKEGLKKIFFSKFKTMFWFLQETDFFYRAYL